MIQTAILAIWGGVPVALQGNAKIYDGSFDYDTINSFVVPNYTQPQSWLIAFKADTLLSVQILYDERTTNAGRTIFLIPNAGSPYLEFSINYGQGNFDAFTNSNIVQGYNILQVFEDGTAGGVKMVLNGLEEQIRRVTGTPASISGVKNVTIARRGPSSGLFFDGLIRKFQILDTDYYGTSSADDAKRLATYENVVADARFSLDIDFNRTGTQNLITRPSTPNYAITAFGGAQYQKYYGT